jgi:hypothetical protein
LKEISEVFLLLKKELTFPFLEFHAIWRLRFHFFRSDFLPVCAQDGAMGFHEGFVHCSSGFFTAAVVDLLEKRLKSFFALI